MEHTTGQRAVFSVQYEYWSAFKTKGTHFGFAHFPQEWYPSKSLGRDAQIRVDPILEALSGTHWWCSEAMEDQASVAETSMTCMCVQVYGGIGIIS